MILRRIALLLVAALLVTVAAQPAARADEIRDQQWHLQYLHIGDAHRITEGAGVLVGLTDSGVDPRAAELGDAILPGTETYADGTGDGREDSDGHGTSMAGLIAGRGTGDGRGVLGIAPKAQILPIRVSPAPDFGGSSKELAAGIDWAVEHHATVISVSLGSDSDRRAEEAVDRALAADVVIVAAVGNKPKTAKVAFPASHPGVLAVGSVDRQGEVYKNSVTGPEVMLTAPGVEIMSTDFEGRHRVTTGTSDATAIVAGAAALVRAKYPELSAADVVRRLALTAQDKGEPGRDPSYGYGVLDIVRALTADVPPASAASSWAPARPGGTGRSAAVIAAVAAAVVVMVFIAVLQSILRSRRRPHRP